MRVAVLDLGTNTFHLLIAEVSNGKVPAELFKESDSVKLGEGGITQGVITEQAFKRGINTLIRFNKAIREHQVDAIRAVGTAALRSAKNGADFIREVEEKTGIVIEIIAGDKEAGIIYEGVRHAMELPETPVLIMDIGGGSVEFIICNNEKIFWKHSYPLGAARLMAEFHRSDPICDEEINAINEYLEEKLGGLRKACEEFRPDLLIGSAGAFDTFTELEVSRYHLDPNILKQSEFTFNMDRFAAITEDLLKSTHTERSQMKGIPEVRVDMIIVSTILTRYILKALGINKMKLSAYSLKEGLLYSTDDSSEQEKSN